MKNRCGKMFNLAFSCMLAPLALPLPASAQTGDVPPKAAQISGEIGQVELGPIFGQRFLCVEHAIGELDYAGDALGTDCLVSGGVEQDYLQPGKWTGFPKVYRTDGRSNDDWYGYDEDVLSPVSGVVVAAIVNKTDNVPGTLGQPPATGLRILTADGVVVSVGHLRTLRFAKGDNVRAGDVLGKVGNNGQGRAPGVHIGAYRERDAAPLQIRWNLRSMAAARRAAGVP
jgi:hypothetical protein